MVFTISTSSHTKRWIDRDNLKHVHQMTANLPATTYLLPTNQGKNPRDLSQQHHNDPNHGQLIYVHQSDRGTQQGDSGIYLVLCMEISIGCS